ncbi:MAG: SPOR domain-containing protein [Candidatus Sericytochromatia bacterium]|nr:SPOR domain-containing protein [Candidatus Sericytochromatia bacterium]
MARNNDDDELEFEDEDEEGFDDEEDEDFDDEDDEDEDDEEGSGSGGARKAILFSLLGLTLLGGGAYAAMQMGVEIPLLSSVMPATSEVVPATPPPSVPVANPPQVAEPPAQTTPPPAATMAQAGAPGSGGEAPAEPGKAPEAAPAKELPVPVAAKAPVAMSPKENPPDADTSIAPAPVAPKTLKAKGPDKRKTTVGAAAGKARAAQRKTKKVRLAQSGSGWFTVQAGAFNVPENAQSVVERLKAKGLPASRTGSGTGGKWSLWSNYVDSPAKAKTLIRQFRKAGVRGQLVTRQGRYVVFLGSHATEEKAKGIAAKLSGKGLYASVHGQPAQASAGPNRVWVGRFSSRVEAEAMASRVRAAVGFGIVRRL